MKSFFFLGNPGKNQIFGGERLFFSEKNELIPRETLKKSTNKNEYGRTFPNGNSRRNKQGIGIGNSKL